MKLGFMTHLWTPEGVTTDQRFAQLLRKARVADEVGLDYAFCVEHHFVPAESPLCAPGAVCAAIGAVTNRIRVGPMGYIAPIWDPIRLLEEVATIDNITAGRAEIGLVSGVIPHFFQGFQSKLDSAQETLEKRSDLVREMVEIYHSAFATKETALFGFEGLSANYKDLPLSIRPMQQPHPPLWCASRDENMLAYLAEKGVNTGYLYLAPRDEVAPRLAKYRQLWETAGHPRKPEVCYWAKIYIDKTDEIAIAKCRKHFQTWLKRHMVGPFDLEKFAPVYKEKGEFGALKILQNLQDFDALLEHNHVFAGSPETVAENILSAANEGNFNCFLGEFNFGGLDEEDVLRSVRLAGTHVLPAIRTFDPLDRLLAS